MCRGAALFPGPSQHAVTKKHQKEPGSLGPISPGDEGCLYSFQAVAWGGCSTGAQAVWADTSTLPVDTAHGPRRELPFSYFLQTVYYFKGAGKDQAIFIWPFILTLLSSTHRDTQFWENLLLLTEKGSGNKEESQKEAR